MLTLWLNSNTAEKVAWGNWCCVQCLLSNLLSWWVCPSCLGYQCYLLLQQHLTHPEGSSKQLPYVHGTVDAFAYLSWLWGFCKVCMAGTPPNLLQRKIWIFPDLESFCELAAFCTISKSMLKMLVVLLKITRLVKLDFKHDWTNRWDKQNPTSAVE